MSSNLTISLVQSELQWENRGANLKHFDALLANLPSTDLVVLPEMFTTGFSMASTRLAETMQGRTLQWLQQRADQHNIALCGSLIIEDQHRYYNRFVLAQPGQAVVSYDKRHLFRMGEEHEHYSAGSKQVICTINGFKICPQICYDLRFPVWSRNRQSYDLLLYVANWPARRRRHWLSLLQARGIENQCYVVAVNRLGSDANGTNYSGDSIIYNYDGAILLNLASKASIETICLEKQPLTQYRNDFPAWKDADEFILQT
ncbi:MAG: amidohydrolase [Pseudomonadales bacterium]|nr:amidohydrolase [Pseudomonadales bacterium]